MENWPDAIAALAPPHVGCALSSTDLDALISQEPSLRALIGVDSRHCFSSTLHEWISREIRRFPAGAFARLGLCSFVTHHHPPIRLKTSWQVLRQLAHPGERAVSMAFRRRFAPEPVWLYLREWRDIPPWTEIRLFFCNRLLVGATQAHGTRVFPELVASTADVLEVIHIVANQFSDLLHVPDVVVDISLVQRNGTLGFELVELNPLSRATGPGLFSWDHDGDFDRTFRHRGLDGSPSLIPLCALK